MSITHLPSEMILHIFKFLPAEDIFSMTKIYPEWGRIAYQKSLWSQFQCITLDNEKMSLGQIKTFVKFVIKRSRFVITLKFLNFYDPADFLDTFLFVRATKLSMRNLIVERTMLDNTTIRKIKHGYFGLNSIALSMGEHPTTDILRKLNRTSTKEIRIAVLSNTNENVYEYQCSTKSSDSQMQISYPEVITWNHWKISGTGTCSFTYCV